QQARDFFFSSRRRHTRWPRDWSSDVCSSDLRLRLTKDDPAYNALKTLFAAELEQQGVGTYADIRNNNYDSFLPVPYWAWMEHERSEERRVGKECRSRWSPNH